MELRMSISKMSRPGVNVAHRVNWPGLRAAVEAGQIVPARYRVGPPPTPAPASWPLVAREDHKLWRAMPQFPPQLEHLILEQDVSVVRIELCEAGSYSLG